MLGHSWQDFSYDVTKSVASFVITGVIAFVAVQRLKLSERAMAVTHGDMIKVALALLAILMSIAVPVFGGLVVTLLVARLFYERYWLPRHPP